MRRSRHGFTLVELAVVIVILGLAAAVVFPRLNAGAPARGELRTSVARIAAIATHARNRAACTRRIHVLHLDTKSGEYWVSDLSRASRSNDQVSGVFRHTAAVAVCHAQASLGRAIIRGCLPSGARFEEIEMVDQSPLPEAIVRLRFSPEGWADPAVIHVMGQDGDVAGLAITGLCGRVETYDSRVRVAEVWE